MYICLHVGTRDLRIIWKSSSKRDVKYTYRSSMKLDKGQRSFRIKISSLLNFTCTPVKMSSFETIEYFFRKLYDFLGILRFHTFYSRGFVDHFRHNNKKRYFVIHKVIQRLRDLGDSFDSSEMKTNLEYENFLYFQLCYRPVKLLDEKKLTA